MCRPSRWIFLIFACVFGLPLSAAIHNVDNKNSLCNDLSGQPFCQISAALNAASNGDEIRIGSGIYFDNLVIDKKILIAGIEDQAVIIDADHRSNVIRVEPGVHAQIKNITLQHGSAENGGGIYNEGSLLINNVNVINNVAKFSGGGIYNASSVSGSLFIKKSTVQFNQSLGNDVRNIKYGGGGIFSDAPLFIENSMIRNNVAVDNGGGIYSIFSGRKKSSDGEKIAEKLGISTKPKRQRTLNRKKDLGAVSIKQSDISHNQSNAGGGIYMHGVMKIKNATISHNYATNGLRSAGGGLFVHFDTTLDMSNVLLNFNKASFRGGGVRFYSVGIGKFHNVSIIDNAIELGYGEGAGFFIIKGEKSLELGNTLIARNFVKEKILDDCRGNFISLGNNYLSSIKHCAGYDASLDIYQHYEPTQSIYQWNEKLQRYAVPVHSPLVDKGSQTNCVNALGKNIIDDVYGQKRRITTELNKNTGCSIGAIEY